MGIVVNGCIGCKTKLCAQKWIYLQMRSPQFFLQNIFAGGKINIVHCIRDACRNFIIKPFLCFQHCVIIITQSRINKCENLGFITLNISSIFIIIDMLSVIIKIILSAIIAGIYIMVSIDVVAIFVAFNSITIFINISESIFIVNRYKSRNTKQGSSIFYSTPSQRIFLSSGKVWSDAQNPFAEAKTGFAGTIIIRIFHH